ncbi:MAG: BON domain-containing protein [Polyangiales bacterium]
MGERDRNQYDDRDDHRFENRDESRERGSGTRDWGSRDDRHYYGNQRNQDDRSYYSASRNNQDDRNYSSGQRNQEERDYGARYTGSEGRRYATDYTGYSNAGSSYAAGDRNRDWERNWERARRNDYGQHDYDGRYGSLGSDRDRSSFNYGGGPYAERARPFGFDRNYARNSLGGYGEGLYEGSEWSRLPTQERYGQRDWVERAYNRGPSEGFRGGYGGEGYRGLHSQDSYQGQGYGDRDDSWSQQLRDAGQQVVRRVKRAFRGPKGYKRSDERIREDVSDKLAQQYKLDPSEIEVAVANGDVTLTGTVQSRHEKFLAEELTDDVSGVNEVHNHLRVRREQSQSQTQSSYATGTSTDTSSTVGNQNQSAADAARNRRTA